MRCNNCGTENNDYAQNCARCGAPIGQPQYQQGGYQQPPQGGYQQQPQYQQGGYQQPPPGGYQAPPQYQPAPPKQPRVPTVRSIHIGDMFLVLGAMLAIAAGFDNFCGIAFSAPIQYVVLGLVGIIIGFLVLLLTAMPNMMKALSSKIGILALVFGVVLLIWGLAACFVSRVGLEGGFFASSGLAMIFAGLLNMGILK